MVSTLLHLLRNISSLISQRLFYLFLY